MQGSKPAGTPTEHQALVKDYSPQCSPASESGRWIEFSEVAAAWAGLPEPLRAAILAIVHSVGPAEGTATLSRRQHERPAAPGPHGTGGRYMRSMTLKEGAGCPPLRGAPATLPCLFSNNVYGSNGGSGCATVLRYSAG